MCKFLYSTEEFALLRVIAAILFSKDNRCTGQAQMSWISGDEHTIYASQHVSVLYLGELPYRGVRGLLELHDLLQDGVRLEKPRHCSQEL